MNPDVKLKELVDKWREGRITPEEEAELMLLCDLYSDDELYELSIPDAADLDSFAPELAKLPYSEAQAMAAGVIKQYNKGRATRMMRLAGNRKKWLGVAASLILIAVSGVILLEYLKEKRYNAYCGIINENTEIPTDNFSATLQTGGQSFKLSAKDTGVLKRYRNMQLYNQPGKITYRPIANAGRNDRSQDTQEISTGAQQQYLVQLPDLVLLRMNAQTKIQLHSDTIRGTIRVKLLQGTIYVKVHGQEKEFNIETVLNSTKTKNSDFVLHHSGNSVQIAVVRGAVQTQYSSQKGINLVAKDISALYKVKSVFSTKDTVMIQHNIDINPLLAWTKISREYEHVPFRYFIEEIGIWYGLRFEKTECLPNKNIDAKICYKAPLAEFLSILERNDIKVYHTPQGSYAFCEPEPLKLKAETRLRVIAMNDIKKR